MRLVPALTLVAGASLATTPIAAAQHEGDVALGVQDGVIRTGLFVDGVAQPQRTFGAVLGDSGFPGFTSDPGFNALPETFPIAARVGWNATAGLRAWTGERFVPADGASLRVSFGTLQFEVFDAPTPGFDLAVQPDGGFHKHLNFFLRGPEGAAPDPGIYLLELESYATDPSIASSPPYWIVFDHEAPEQHADAIAWVLAHLDSPCPSDLDGDGAVGLGDLLVVLSAWGPCAGDCPDLDDDGMVGLSDLLVVLATWGACGDA